MQLLFRNESSKVKINLSFELHQLPFILLDQEMALRGIKKKIRVCVQRGVDWQGMWGGSKAFQWNQLESRGEQLSRISWTRFHRGKDVLPRFDNLNSSGFLVVIHFSQIFSYSDVYLLLLWAICSSPGSSSFSQLSAAAAQWLGETGDGTDLLMTHRRGVIRE